MAQVLLKNGARGFQNSLPFDRLESFYVIISQCYKRFQYFNLEKIFWKIKTFFRKVENCFFS